MKTERPFIFLKEGDERPPYIGEADVRGKTTKFTHLLKSYYNEDERLQQIGWNDEQGRRCTTFVFKNTIKLYDESE